MMAFRDASAIRACLVALSSVAVFSSSVAAQESTRADSTRKSAQALPTVSVEAKAAPDPYGFNERRRNSTGGIFLTEADIALRHAFRAEQIFRGIPTIVVDTGGLIWVDRGRISYRDYFLKKQDLQGASTCVGAQILVNRVEMAMPFSINEIDPGSIHAI